MTLSEDHETDKQQLAFEVVARSLPECPGVLHLPRDQEHKPMSEAMRTEEVAKAYPHFVACARRDWYLEEAEHTLPSWLAQT